MAHPDEVPDRDKDPGHTIPLKDWEQVRVRAAELASDEAPPSEDDADDEEMLKWL